MTNFQRMVVGGVLIGILFSILVVPWGSYLKSSEGEYFGPGEVIYAIVWSRPHAYAFGPMTTDPLIGIHVRIVWWRVLVQVAAIILTGAVILVLVRR